MEFDQKKLLAKYAELRQQYANPYEPDLSPEGRTVRYAKIPDVSASANLYSRAILRHFDSKKALFPRQYAKLPKGADAAEYDALYFDPDGRLHHLDYCAPGFGRFAAVLDSDQLVLTYRIFDQPDRKPFITLLTMEWTEYGADGEPVSVTEFRRNGSLADGVIINCEYYQYENGRMCHADRFAEFDSDFSGGGLITRLAPDKILNPEIFSYDFQRTEGGVRCTRTHFWSRSKTYRASILMPEKELLKLEKNGIRCFL